MLQPWGHFILSEFTTSVKSHSNVETKLEFIIAGLISGNQ